MKERGKFSPKENPEPGTVSPPGKKKRGLEVSCFKGAPLRSSPRPAASSDSGDSGDSGTPGLLITGKDGGMIGYNQNLLELWRIPTSMLDARNETRLIEYVLDQAASPEGFLKGMVDLWSQTRGEDYEVIEMKDGRRLFLTLQVQEMAGEPVAWVWNFWDITHQQVQ
jgi:PAS domain-containing protein